MVKIKLISTHQHGERFAQEWLITDHDGGEHTVESDSEWGDVAIESGGDRMFDIGGTPVIASQIVACEISAVPNCTIDGDETEVNAEWLQRVLEAGVRRDCLNIDCS